MIMVLVLVAVEVLVRLVVMAQTQVLVDQVLLEAWVSQLGFRVHQFFMQVVAVVAAVVVQTLTVA
jgi:hypothetical protein